MFIVIGLFSKIKQSGIPQIYEPTNTSLSKKYKKNFDNLFFEQNKNSLIIKNIQEIFKNKENQIYIYGKKSLGKTHLLYSACNYFDNKKVCISSTFREKIISSRYF